MRAQARPRSSQVPRPTSGILAPFASMLGIGSSSLISRPQDRAKRGRFPVGSPAPLPRGGKYRLSFAAQHLEGRLGRFIEHLEERARRPPRRALALLPV